MHEQLWIGHRPHMTIHTPLNRGAKKVKNRKIDMTASVFEPVTSLSHMAIPEPDRKRENLDGHLESCSGTWACETDTNGNSGIMNQRLRAQSRKFFFLPCVWEEYLLY